MKYFAYLLFIASTINMCGMNNEKKEIVQPLYSTKHERRSPLSPILAQYLALRHAQTCIMPTTPPIWHREMPVSPP